MSFLFTATKIATVYARTWMVYLALGGLAAMAFGQPFVAVAQAPPGGGLTDQPATDPAENSQTGANLADADRRQAFFDGLYQELDGMVPGEFKEGSPQKEEMKRGINAFLDHDIETLNEILDQLATFDPNFPPKHLMLASLSFRINEPKQGRALLEKAAMKSPNYPGTYAAFARLALSEGRITDSMALLEKGARVVRENDIGEDVKMHFSRQYITGMIQVAMAQKRYAYARELFAQRLKLGPPATAQNYLTGAEVEFSLRNLKKSKSYLEKRKELMPKARPYESIFARWSLERGASKAVEKWVTQAAENYPDDAVRQLDYAKWLIGESEDLKDVSAAIAKVEGLSGETPETRFLKGQVAFADDRMEEAERLFQQVVADSQGRNLAAKNLYALALTESSDPEKHAKAQQIAQQTLSSAPRSDVVRAALAYIVFRQGDTERAQEILAPALGKKRIAAPVAYFSGYMMNELGNKDAARKALRSALSKQGLFLYRKKCQRLLDKLGGSIPDDLPEPMLPNEEMPFEFPTP